MIVQGKPLTLYKHLVTKTKYFKRLEKLPLIYIYMAENGRKNIFIPIHTSSCKSRESKEDDLDGDI